MPIPEFRPDGYLPLDVHRATEEAFARGLPSSARPASWMVD
jgi:hypothetical protein